MYWSRVSRRVPRKSQDSLEAVDGGRNRGSSTGLLLAGRMDRDAYGGRAVGRVRDVGRTGGLDCVERRRRRPVRKAGMS